VGLIVVDYLQLLSGSSITRGGGRVHEVSEITTGLKALAKELNLPIIMLRVAIDRPPDETREQWLARTARERDLLAPAIVGPAARPTNGRDNS
jgi:replicative DNA helicase